jgi:hypothetical protein
MALSGRITAVTAAAAAMTHTPVHRQDVIRSVLLLEMRMLRHTRRGICAESGEKNVRRLEEWQWRSRAVSDQCSVRS